MQVTLYKGLTCPKCKVVAMKMDKKGIKYDVVTDVNYMMSIGIHTIPTLEVDGVRYTDVKACNDWVNSQEGAV
jgi:glutaredoxin